MSDFTRYVPSLSGLLLGNGTVDARYTDRGFGHYELRVHLTFGSSTAVADPVVVSLPDAPVAEFFANVHYYDTSANLHFVGDAELEHDGRIRLVVPNYGTESNNMYNDLSQTTPCVWAAGDTITLLGLATRA